jgi:uncharacterized membrane protein YbhN (UPF0104 family)
MPNASAETTKSWLLAAVKIAVSIGLLYLLARNTDLTAVWKAMRELPLWAAVLAWAILVVQSSIIGLRWWLVMGAIGSPAGLGRTIGLTFVGVFFNQVLPTSFGGDAVRIWRVYRDGVRYQTAINGVLLERISGVAGLVVLVALGVAYMGPRIDNPAVQYGLLAVLPLTLLGVVVLTTMDRLPNAWRRWRAMQDLVELAGDGRRIFFNLPTGSLLLVLSLISHMLAAASIFALARGLGLDMALGDSLALVPAVILITLIPLSFAGWGIREGAMVAMLAFAGVSTDAALAVSILFGLALLAASLPGCLVWLT